mmetsp:Transcript_34719/g.104648  ORF Transcript_34719/g.104648 Transcript_34719/m.104648 type:complete len:87 (+) Transcript_34719:184-444(+)
MIKWSTTHRQTMLDFVEEKLEFQHAILVRERSAIQWYVAFAGTRDERRSGCVDVDCGTARNADGVFESLVVSDFHQTRPPRQPCNV